MNLNIQIPLVRELSPKTPTEKIKKKGDKKMSEAMYKIRDLSEDEFIFITAFMKEIKNLISRISAMTQEERLSYAIL